MANKNKNKKIEHFSRMYPTLTREQIIVGYDSMGPKKKNKYINRFLQERFFRDL